MFPQARILEMQILFHTYDLAFLRMGGGERVILSLQKELKKLGHGVDIFNPWKDNPQEYDIHHYFSTLHSESWKHLRKFAPLVVTPTFSPHARVSAKLKRDLNFPDLVLPNTALENSHINKFCKKTVILPNGIERTVTTGDPQIIWKRIGSKNIHWPLVLCVGRFDRIKNQEILLRSLNHLTKIVCVFLGNPEPQNSSYFDFCKSLAEEIKNSHKSVEIFFLPAVPQEDPLLSSAYAAAAAVVQPSIFETYGLAALEACAAGNNLALTKNMADPSIFAEYAKFFDPQEPEACAEAIGWCLGQKRSGFRSNVLEKFSWNRIASVLAEQYEEVLNA